MKQPEALRLADVLEHFYMNIGKFDSHGAATELRRLHEANQAMLEALEEMLAAERMSIRPPITVMQAEERLARIRSAAAKAEAAIAKGEQQ
jgi:DNA replication initiation complex subunit (GINS family)